MFAHFTLLCPPFITSNDTSYCRTPPQTSKSNVQSSTMYISFLGHSTSSSFGLHHMAFGTLKQFPYKICISHTIQALLWPIMSKDFFHTYIIESLVNKNILFYLDFAPLHLKFSGYFDTMPLGMVERCTQD